MSNVGPHEALSGVFRRSSPAAPYITPGRLSCRACGAAFKVEQSVAVMADRQMNLAFAAVAVAALALMVWSGAQGKLVPLREPSLREVAAVIQSYAKSPVQSLASAAWWLLQTVALVVLFMAAVAAVVVGSNSV